MSQRHFNEYRFVQSGKREAERDEQKECQFKLCTKPYEGRAFLSVSSFCASDVVVTRSEPLGMSSTVALN